jgi:hypothetical protein
MSACDKIELEIELASVEPEVGLLDDEWAQISSKTCINLPKDLGENSLSPRPGKPRHRSRRLTSKKDSGSLDTSDSQLCVTHANVSRSISVPLPETGNKEVANFSDIPRNISVPLHEIDEEDMQHQQFR